MKFCPHCGAEVNENAIVCTKCGCEVNNTKPATRENDEISVGLVILSVLIPLFGVIYWPVKAKETPKKAKACGIAGLISWGVSILISVLYSSIIMSALGSMF